MKELLAYLASLLVDYPQEVEVWEVEGERSLTLELAVHPDDTGKIIGRRGRVAAALRTLVKAAAGQAGKRVFVKIG